MIEPIPPVPHETTIEERIDAIASEYNIASTTLYNLAFNESSLNPDARVEIPPTKGCPDGSIDRGIVQINDCYNADVTDEEAYNPEIALRWAAEKIQKGDAWKLWSVCNCFTYAKVLLGDLPKMADLAPNGPPRVGSIAIFNYRGTKHLGVISTLEGKYFTVKEANFHPCDMDTRKIAWNDPALIGFYNKLATSANPN